MATASESTQETSETVSKSDIRAQIGKMESNLKALEAEVQSLRANVQQVKQMHDNKQNEANIIRVQITALKNLVDPPKENQEDEREETEDS